MVENMDMQTIQSVLQDIHYPITKDELIEEIKKRGVPEILPLIRNELPPQTFNSVEEIMDKLPLSNIKGMFGL
jgi:hypothetical protein